LITGKDNFDTLKTKSLKGKDKIVANLRLISLSKRTKK